MTFHLLNQFRDVGLQDKFDAIVEETAWARREFFDLIIDPVDPLDSS